MTLCWAKYKKKNILFLALGTKNGNIMALKVQESKNQLMSDKSISNLRSSYKKLMKMKLKNRLLEIKNLVPEYSKIYRTYNPAFLKIFNKYQINS